MLFNSKGQAEAVFEVLIAVILLSFVLVIGSISMNTISNNKCSKEIDISLKDFVLNIERVSSSSLASKSYLFGLPNCFGPDADVKIISESDSALCSSYCPGSTGGCYLMQYDNNKDKVNPRRYNCLNISPITVLNDNGICNQGNLALVDSSQGNGAYSLEYKFTRGKYLITSASLQRPNICIYKEDN